MDGQSACSYALISGSASLWKRHVIKKSQNAYEQSPTRLTVHDSLSEATESSQDSCGGQYSCKGTLLLTTQPSLHAD